MDKKEFKKFFYEVLNPFFKDNRFKLTSEFQYKKTINDVKHIITFAPRKAKSGGFATSVGFGIRVPKIERVIHPNDSESQTVGMPLHLLKPEKKYNLWAFDKKKDFLIAKKVIVSDIEKFGFPFLKKFSKSCDIWMSLKSENPSNWFMCTPDNRDSLLVVFSFINSGKKEALYLGNELIQKYNGKMKKFYKNLSEAIKIIDEI